MDIPETKYAKTVDGVHIAYQVLGDGPVDMVYLRPCFSHMEYGWEGPREGRFLWTLAPFYPRRSCSIDVARACPTG